VAFDLDLTLPTADALAFVRDVPRSLAHADFLRSLRVEGADPVVVVAELPVNAALFGQRLLPFRSELVPTPRGARLIGLPLEHDGPGWAQVDGEAEVEPSSTGAGCGTASTCGSTCACPRRSAGAATRCCG
jgi:hypothetical protein